MTGQLFINSFFEKRKKHNFSYIFLFQTTETCVSNDVGVKCLCEGINLTI